MYIHMCVYIYIEAHYLHMHIHMYVYIRMAWSCLLSLPCGVVRSAAWGPNGPTWALMGRTLMTPLGSHGPGPNGSALGPHGLGACGRPMGPDGPGPNDAPSCCRL